MRVRITVSTEFVELKCFRWDSEVERSSNEKLKQQIQDFLDKPAEEDDICESILRENWTAKAISLGGCIDVIDIKYLDCDRGGEVISEADYAPNMFTVNYEDVFDKEVLQGNGARICLYSCSRGEGMTFSAEIELDKPFDPVYLFVGKTGIYYGFHKLEILSSGKVVECLDCDWWTAEGVFDDEIIEVTESYTYFITKRLKLKQDLRDGRI